MKIKNVASVLLILFVAASVVTLFVRGVGNKPEIPGPAGDPVAAEGGETAQSTEEREARHAVYAYYFYGNFRCATCRRIEAYSKEAIEAAFPDELKTGKLVWQPVNVDDPPNEHFTHDYDLATRSLVLSEVKNGTEIKWKNLEKVWDLVGDKEKFFEYVRDETTEYVERI